MRNHTQTTAVRLVLARKTTVEPTSLSYDHALLEALCFGWIDGQVGRRDEKTYFQRFSPRRTRSTWSQRNTELAMELIGSGRMQPAGLAEIERARADGRWDAAYRQATAELPDDLAAAISADPAATTMLATLTRQNRFAMIFRLNSVTRAETRERKIADYVAMLARGETIYPQRGSTTDSATEQES